VPQKHQDVTDTRRLDASRGRATEIVASLRAGDPPDVFDAFWELDALPADEVRDALAAWTGPLPDPERLDSATRLAHGMSPRPLRLRALSVTRDADVLDLGSIAEEQLRLAGKSWDGADLAPEERLDGELDGSFAGTLERHVLADADAAGETPLFDVLLFAEDSGVVFAAGTTKVVALIAYRKVEMRDRRTRVAIEEAVGTRRASSEATAPASAVAAAAVVTEPLEDATGGAPIAKKTVAKKAAAKKAAVKTTAAKKTVAKKTVAKKASAKKTAKARAR
jgi:hypothetical protein